MQMHIRSLRYIATLILSGAIFTILVGMASVWFLRSLGEILASLAPALGLDSGTADMISEIFGQLKDATLNLPLEYTGVICFLYCALVILFVSGHRKEKTPANTAAEPPKKKKTGRIVLVIVLGVILFLPFTAITIWFTEVNYVRFDRVIQSLIPLLQSGIL